MKAYLTISIFYLIKWKFQNKDGKEPWFRFLSFIVTDDSWNLVFNNIKENIQEGVVLVDFWAPWCGPCRMLAPAIDQLAEEFENKAKICKVNTEEEPDLTSEYQVRSIPTILFFKNGEIVDQMIGATTKAKLEEKLNSLL